MAPPSHGRFSRNWKSADDGSKRQTRISEIAKVISVVHSATQRALRDAGFVVAQERDEHRAGDRQEGDDGKDRPARHQCSPREHEPGDERGDADQHGEGVVVEIAGLQPDDIARHVEHARGDAVGPEAVDDEAVAALPEQPAEPHRRADKEEVVDAVEVPGVEQEAIEHALIARERRGDIGPADIELPGHQKTADHHHRRRQRHGERQMLHVLQHVLPGPNISELRKNSSAPSPSKMCRNGQPAAIEPIASTASGMSMTSGLSCAAS